MSHITKCKTTFRSLEALRSAVGRLGGTFHEGQRTHRYYSGNGQCEHAISFPGASYEVGVTQQQDGSYGLAYDAWSNGGLGQALGGANGERLAREYAAEETRAWFNEQGVPFTEYEKDGELHLLAHMN